MSDDKKKNGQQPRPATGKSEELRRHEQEKSRQREEWSKIEKRGSGAGDRPKK